MFYPEQKFIDTLSKGEKFIFLKVICGVIASDRQVSKEEIVYLKELALKYEVDGESLAVMIKTANKEALIRQARLIDERHKALMLIKDLCMVANNDTDLADNEIEYILDVAEVMGIDPMRVKDINQAVNDYLELVFKTKKLLEIDDCM
jgi:uncharacterized tellurite resistance protein B-like protein